MRSLARELGSVVADGARDRRYRVRVLLLLGLTLALDYADRSSVGALGPDLKRAFDISNTDFGLLASAFSVVGGLATLPAGVLTDRTRRTSVLAAAVALWGLAMIATGAATTFLLLISARVFLGAVTATARPALFSITGDVFPQRVRGRALGLIGSGEIVGNGIGFLLAGSIAVVLTWRGVFWLLGAAGMVLVVLLWRLPEPPRRRKGDAEQWSFLEAMRCVIEVRTQLLVMTATAIGSFFFAGLRTFVIVFAVKAYGVDRSVADLALLVAGVGGVAGILGGGRLGDLLAERGRRTGRLDVALASYVVAVAALVPAFLLPSLWWALPLYVIGAAAISAPIPPLDAVRLDVMDPRLWGRAEAARTILLVAAEAGAPLLFGFLADRIAGGGTAGLRWTFMIGLATLAISAAVLTLARRTYPREARPS
jgi:predicted MFS family arabinose efflux permease